MLRELTAKANTPTVYYHVYFIPSDNLEGFIPQFYSPFPSLFLKMCNGVSQRYGEQFLLNQSQHYTLLTISSDDHQGKLHDSVISNLNECKTIDTDYLMQNLIERYARAWTSNERRQIRSNLDRMVVLNENVLENRSEEEVDVLELYQRVMSYPEKPKKLK